MSANDGCTPPGCAPAQRAGLFVCVFALWLLLTGSLAADEVIAGLLVALATAWLTPRPPLGGLRLSPAALGHLAAYLAVFTVALVRSNLDVARRVLTPSLPIDPAVVRVRTGLTSDLGRLLLANSITLTPGTLTVDVDGDELLVHWLDCPDDADLEAATREIAAAFEKHLKGFVA